MVAILPVPQAELKTLAESNIKLLADTQELVKLIEQVADNNLRNQMLSRISGLIGVGQAIDRTVRAAVYSSNTTPYAA